MRPNPLLLAAALALLPAAQALAERGPVPPDPEQDPMLITAGFLASHPDMNYRLLGMEAFRDQRYEDALRLFRRAAFYADKASQGMVAEMYWTGRGVERDPVLAYVWMDLAAERGYPQFIALRERYWKALDAAQQARAVEEGQAVYATFGDDVARPRYAFHLRNARREMTGSRTGFNRGVAIEVPGPSGNQSVEGSKYYDERYWDPEKYFAWQDRLWKGGRVEVGEVERTDAPPPPPPPPPAPPSR